jgi:hypothetical protein
MCVNLSHVAQERDNDPRRLQEARKLYIGAHRVVIVAVEGIGEIRSNEQ